MDDKPIYDILDIGPVCSRCGANYRHKRVLSSRCPECRFSLPGWVWWLLAGMITGIAFAIILSRYLPEPAMLAIAGLAATAAAVVMIWRLHA